MTDHAPPWLTKLSDRLYFGPRPKTPEDVAHLTQHLGVSCIVNASTSDACDKHTQLPLRTAYVRDYRKRYHFMALDAPLPPEALHTSKGAPALLAAVRHLKERIDELSARPVHPVCYVHAETGLADEAYIGIVLWRLMAADEAPADRRVPTDIEQWLREQNKEALFDDDADKRSLLVAVWKLLDTEDDKRAKMRAFGVVVTKRPKTGE